VSEDLDSKRNICIFSGLAGVIGVVLLGLSFAINAGPPPNATSADLMIRGAAPAFCPGYGAPALAVRFWPYRTVSRTERAVRPISISDIKDVLVLATLFEVE